MIIFVIIGALIGAGFASGQEIYLFFYRYGKNGILGLLICSILIGIVIYKTFIIILKNKNITNYKLFLDEIFHAKKSKKKYLNFSYISNIIINIFLLITFYIMISGFGAYFEQEFNINSIIGAIILAIICYYIFMTSIKGVTKANTIVVPILILCILIIGLKNVSQINFENIGKNITTIPKGWFLQSIIYCSYNIILLIPVLVNLREYLKSKKQIIKISVLTGIIVFILAINIYLLMVNVDVNFKNLEMPAVYVISQKFANFRGIYGIVILLSIFTTAISIGMGFLENVVKNKKNYPQIAAIMCISSVLVSKIGFSNLVKILFPVFGYLGLLQIIFIFVRFHKLHT